MKKKCYKTCLNIHCSLTASCVFSQEDTTWIQDSVTHFGFPLVAVVFYHLHLAPIITERLNNL